MSKVSFYPGCSLLGTSREYLESTIQICDGLGIELIELDDWCCCGASSAHAVSYESSVLLPARNLALAQDLGLPLIASCTACYSRLKIAQKEIKENKAIRDKVADVLGKTGDSVKIYLLLEYIMSNESVKNKLKSTIKTGLAGLKIVSYYGCLMTRPPEAIRFDDVENPVIMDELVEILGGEPVDWAMKTECCGASLSLTKSNIVHNLVDKILDYAQRSGAEAIMTACPLCLLNLEMRRIGKYDIPVFYFTELIGITQKNPNLSKWLKYHLVDAFGTLRKKELI